MLVGAWVREWHTLGGYQTLLILMCGCVCTIAHDGMVSCCAATVLSSRDAPCAAPYSTVKALAGGST